MMMMALMMVKATRIFQNNISQRFNTSFISKSSCVGKDLKDRLKYLQEELDFKLEVPTKSG